MKICKIYLRGFDQFQDVSLDFTHPQTGLPSDRICFIGRNGTGKSKLLLLMTQFLINMVRNYRSGRVGFESLALAENKIVIKFLHKNAHYYALISNFPSSGIEKIYNGQDVNDEKSFIAEIIDLNMPRLNTGDPYLELTAGMRNREFVNELKFDDNSNDLIIYSPAESQNNNYGFVEDVPPVKLNDALELFNKFQSFHIVSHGTLNEFWKVLIFNIKKLEELREKYETTPENINKTKAQLLEEFDKLYPTILDKLAKLWNAILSKAGLEFDVRNAKKPVQLNDTFQAYINLKSNGKKIPYSELSSGIRNFIFRLGHIYSLYFNRQVDRGFLFVDEPENSLYPDFLFDLVEAYKQVIVDERGQNNTQMFFATHHPIVAAQFEPYERVILDWNGDGSVSAKRGYSPIGDDPNDVLSNDFELPNLMGPEGRKIWKHYENLKKALIRAESMQEKEELVKEINKIGLRYNFS
jgi:predicted ATP-dependent endonuclease of OLD family